MSKEFEKEGWQDLICAPRQWEECRVLSGSRKVLIGLTEMSALTTLLSDPEKSLRCGQGPSLVRFRTGPSINLPLVARKQLWNLWVPVRLNLVFCGHCFHTWLQHLPTSLGFAGCDFCIDPREWDWERPTRSPPSPCVMTGALSRIALDSSSWLLGPSSHPVPHRLPWQITRHWKPEG